MSDAEFARTSVLDILIPEVTDLDIEEALSSVEETSQSDESALISAIPQRSLLYFDESLSVYVVLKTPYQDHALLQSHISRLAIALEAHAISSPSVTITSPTNETRRPASNAVPNRDVIWSDKLDVTQDPIIIVAGSDDTEDGQDVLLIWRLGAFLSRPRIRLQAPAVIFKVSASLQPPKSSSSIASNTIDPYLPSGLPLPSNALSPLSNDPYLKGIAPVLSSTRFSRVTRSVAPQSSDAHPLRVVSRRAFRAIPAISSRMRYHRSSNKNSDPSVVAVLELDIPGFALHNIELSSIVLDLADGSKQTMLNTLELPMTCHARDNLICFYALTPTRTPSESSRASLKPTSIDVRIHANALVSDSCHPKIQIHWKTSIDFFASLNPNQTKPNQMNQPVGRPGSIQTLTPIPTPKTPHQSMLSSVASSLLNADTGLTITITGPPAIYVGEPFHWDIFIVNRSPKTRQLSLSMTPKRRRDGKRLSQRPTSSSATAANRTGVIADAVVDENLLYAMTRSHGSDPMSLVCLSSDVIVGPIQSGSCYATELEFLPLAKGFLTIESIRVVDVLTNEAVEIYDLPDVMALERF